jgi:nucleoside-diphosphate-sugar epimerase
MKNILVTGGAGYIGSILIPKLLSAGHKVTVIDNFMYNQTSLAASVSNEHLDIVVGDVRDYSLITKFIAKSDIIIPLAAIVGAPACQRDPTSASSVNKDATLWLINQLSDDQQVIMPTTNSAYGSGDKGNYCDEKTQLRPLSLYARDKVLVEKHLMEKGNATSYRLATVFGVSPRMRLDLMLNNFVHRAITDKFLILFEGHFKRNFVHVSDVAEAFIFAINYPSKVKNEIFNFGLSDANLSKLQLCELIKTYVPNFVYQEAALEKDPDQRNYVVSNKKIESIGMRAKVTLDEGIRELIKGSGMFTNYLFTNLR